MKTYKVDMKNEIVNFLNELGFGYKFLINGFIGGLVYAIYKKSKFWDSVRQVFVGSIVSAYITPIIAEKLSLTYVGFLSFTIGMVGMVVVDLIYKWIVKKIKLLF